MKRKLVAMFLVLAMGLGIVACGSSAQTGSTGEATPKETEKAEAAVNTEAAGGTEAAAEPEVPSDPADWPTIKVEVCSFTDALEKEGEIEKALNEYLVSINAGVQADLLPIAIGDRSTQLTLMLTDTNDPIDLFAWRWYSSVTDLVKNGQCISLEKYRDVYPELWELFPESVYDTCKVNGEQYSMPGADSFSNFQVYAMRKDVAEEIGVMDLADTKITMDQFNEILAKAEAAHPELCWHGDTFVKPLMGVDNLGNDKLIGVLMNRGVGAKEIVNYYATDEFKNYCLQCKEWADKGYIVDDPLNTNYAGYTLMNDGIGGGYMFEGYSIDYCYSLMKAQITYDTVIFQLTDLMGDNSCVYNGWQISTVCKNPDAAMKLLYLMYTDEKVARFFALGIEGVTYKVDENGCAWYADGVDVNTVGWNLSAPWFYPNECLCLPFETDYKEYYSAMEALWSDDSIQYSDGMGFVFDNSAVYDQVAACSATVDEYRTALLMGQVDVDSYLEKFNAELEANGINEVIAEMNKQYQEFLAAK